MSEPSFQKKISELRQEMGPSWADERRIEYLKEKTSAGIIEAWGLMNDYGSCKTERKTVEMVMVGNKVLETTKAIYHDLREIRRLNGMDSHHDDITPDMIRTAKEYPFTDLHSFTRNMALCPFHPDKNPSMSLKNNRAHCWSCDWKGDTIAFLMARDGLKFHEAVRRLQ